MDWRSESALMALIERREQEIASLMTTLANATPELSEELLTASVELEDLRNELEFVRRNPPSSDAWDSFVPAPIKPFPHLNSGAIALPEPDEPSN
jgi:hypothetical protein